MTMTSPSRERCTSTSTRSSPWSIASWTARSVFSGPSALAPRWPTVRGGAPYTRRHNLISAAETLNKKLAGKPTVEIDATFESGGQWGDYLQKFTLAAEAKTSPDVILAGHENLAPWVGPSYIVPLDDLIAKYQSEGGIKDVIPTLWSAMKLKGKTYGVPQDTEARPMYYRKDLLAKMGWSKDKIDGLPEAVKKGEWAWPDFVATAKDAIAKGVVGPGKGWYSRPSKGADIYMFYYQNGGGQAGQEKGTAPLLDE